MKSNWTASACWRDVMLPACGSLPADWTTRYPSIAPAVAALSCRSCLIDGEVVICGEDGVPVFDRLRYGRRPQTEAVLFAFDLLELTGNDLRRTPLEERKRALAKLLRKASWALQYNDHIAEAGDIVFRHACKLGFEGIVSKRLGSPYLSGRSRHWLKSKNPAAPAVKREAEEDWGQATMTVAQYGMLKMKTILTAMLLALSVTAAAAQTTYYDPGGDYLGQATRHRNTATFYDSRGSFVGTSVTTGHSTSFFGRDGAFQGTLTRTGDTTNFYDRAGRYQGSVTTVPSPSSPVGTFNLKGRR